MHAAAGGCWRRRRQVLHDWGSAAMILKEQNEEALHD
jgi:hypothetical protein